MSDLLLLLLGSDPDARLRWGAFADGRLVESGWLDNAAALSMLPPTAAADKVVALLPGEQVAARAFPAAPRGAAKLLAAARYLMEDELGEAAEALNIGAAAGRAQPIAFAVRQSIVDNWLEAFAAAGVDCDTLSCDYLALPSSAERATVIGEGDRVVAAFSGLGAAMERELFAELAPQLLANPNMRISVAEDDSLAECFAEAEEVDWLGETDDARVLTIYGEAVSSSPPPSFLQARMINRKALAAALTPWRRAGMIAAALAGVLFLGVIADGVRANREAARWDAAAQRLHQEYFPEQANVDPASFARRRLNQGGGDQSFLWLASRFSDALEANEAVHIDRIRFNAARGEFVVSIRSETDTAIEALKAALIAAGVAAQDSGGYRVSGGVWTGELIARAQ